MLKKKQKQNAHLYCAELCLTTVPSIWSAKASKATFQDRGGCALNGWAATAEDSDLHCRLYTPWPVFNGRQNVGTVWSKLSRAVQTVISILGFKKVL